MRADMSTTKTIGIIRDPLADQIKTTLSGLVDSNIDGIANEVAQSEDGNLSVSFSVKLTLSGLRVAGVGKIGYSRKFTDEAEFITPDPQQQDLPGVELTIETGGGHTAKLDAASLRKGIQAVDRALAAGLTPDDVSAAIAVAKTMKKEGGAA